MRTAKLLSFVLFALCVPWIATAQQKIFTLPPLPEDVAGNLNAVGRVNKGDFQTKGGCSGTLVRPDVVLTAAHCTGPTVARGNKRKMFVAGWRRGNYEAARPVVKALRHPAYSVTGRHDPRFDVGLLFLETPITEVAPLPLALHQQDRVGIAGYHRFIPHLLTGKLDCQVMSKDVHLLLVDCPVVSGNSGGPVLEPNGEGEWQVTAVVSSQERRPGTLRAIAVQVPRWVHDVLAEH